MKKQGFLMKKVMLLLSCVLLSAGAKDGLIYASDVDITEEAEMQYMDDFDIDVYAEEETEADLEEETDVEIVLVETETDTLQTEQEEQILIQEEEQDNLEEPGEIAELLKLNEEAGTGEVYPVCGTLVLGKETPVNVTTDTYYQLDLSESGWYTFEGDYYPYKAILQDMTGVKNGQVVSRYGRVYDSQKIYLEGPVTYYLRFHEQYYDDYDDYDGGIATSFWVTVSKVTVTSDQKIELVSAKTTGAAYVDKDYFKGTSVEVTISEEETYTINLDREWSQTRVKLTYYLEKDGRVYESEGLPPGDYTAHIQCSSNLELAYNYHVADYQEAGYQVLKVGDNKVVDSQVYLFIPEKSDNYCMGQLYNSIEGNSYTYVEIWKADGCEPVSPGEEGYPLEAGTTYLVKVHEVWSGYDTLSIFTKPAITKVEGTTELGGTYLAGANHGSDFSSAKVTYSTGEVTTLDALLRYDKYLNCVKYQYTTASGETVTSNHYINVPKEEGSYQVTISVGGFVFRRKTVNVVRANEYAKTLKQLPYEKAAVVNGNGIFAYTPTWTGYYYLRFTDMFALSVITEGTDGKTIFDNHDDYCCEPPSDYTLYLEAGKTYIFDGMTGSDDNSDYLWLGKKENYCKIYGHNYYYNKCHNCDGYQTLTTPKITKAEIVNEGIRITWGTVKDAYRYRIYRKTANTSWSRLYEWNNYDFRIYSADQAGETRSFTDKTASYGTEYFYTVRCVSEDGMAFTSSFDSAGTSVCKLASITPKLANVPGGVKVSWDKVKGATGYYVYRKDADNPYKVLKVISGGDVVSFGDTTAVSGIRYTYAVRAVRGSSKGWFTPCQIEYLQAVTPTLSNTKSGIRISWKKVAGATGYVVYRKSGSGSYARITTISGGATVSFTDTAVKSKYGTTYTYAVRAKNTTTMGSYYAKTIKRKK